MGNLLLVLMDVAPASDGGLMVCQVLLLLCSVTQDFTCMQYPRLAPLFFVFLFLITGGVHAQMIERFPRNFLLNKHACLNSEVVYEVTPWDASVTQSSTYSYEVNGCELVSQDSNTVVIRWTEVGEHSFTVTVVTPNGTYSRERKVTVNADLPQAPVVIAQDDFSVCQESRTQFEASIEEADAVLRWNLQGLDDGEQRNITYFGLVSSWSETGDYRVYAMAINGCGTGQKDSVDVTVTRRPTTEGLELLGTIPACTDTTYRYAVTGLVPGDYADWTIFGADRTQTVVDDTTIDVIWQSSDQGYVGAYVKSPEGCRSNNRLLDIFNVQGSEALDNNSVFFYDWTNYHYAPVCPDDTVDYRLPVMYQDAHGIKDWHVPEGGTIVFESDARLLVRWDNAGDHRVYGLPYNRCFVGDTLSLKVEVGNGAREPVRHFSNVWVKPGTTGATTISLRWDTRRGSGRHALMTLRPQDSSLVLPADGEAYAASVAYGAGAALGAGTFAVQNVPAEYFNTRSFQVDLRNLSPCTPYQARLYPYNKNTRCPEGGLPFNYLSDSAEHIDFWTDPLSFDALAPTQGVQALRFRESGDSSLQVDMAPGTGSHRLLIVGEGTAVNARPADHVYYAAAPRFGEGHPFADGAYVVYNGSDTTVTVTGLSPDKAYYFKAIEYNQDSTCVIDNAYSDDEREGELGTDLVLGIPAALSSSIRVYQPYGTDWLQVDLAAPAGDHSGVEVYDVHGRLLQAAQFVPGADRLQMTVPSGLAPQLCIVHVLTETKLEARRLVIR